MAITMTTTSKSKSWRKSSNGSFECLGEYIEKYIIFLILIKENENSKAITYIIKLIDGEKFM